ncbi:hypothetical protein EDF70_1021083 [Neorhizobium sp. JUb45]|nr:hypothetical protein EDF70_1021083 [Neorhizobium sp. JUb45]
MEGESADEEVSVFATHARLYVSSGQDEQQVFWALVATIRTWKLSHREAQVLFASRIGRSHRAARWR